jgi:hypothetical protein
MPLRHTSPHSCPSSVNLRPAAMARRLSASSMPPKRRSCSGSQSGSSVHGARNSSSETHVSRRFIRGHFAALLEKATHGQRPRGPRGVEDAGVPLLGKPDAPFRGVAHVDQLDGALRSAGSEERGLPRRGPRGEASTWRGRFDLQLT